MLLLQHDATDLGVSKSMGISSVYMSKLSMKCDLTVSLKRVLYSISAVRMIMTALSVSLNDLSRWT